MKYAFLCLICAFAAPAMAAVQLEAVDYEVDGAPFQGFVAYDDANTEAKPGVLVVHEWWGITDHPKESAKKLAELGYVAFVVDMYGKGKVTEDPGKASEWAGEMKTDPKAARTRFTAAMDQLKAREDVDGGNLGAIGYCFGGTMVLEMARLGLPLKGVVSFHGGLTSQVPGDEQDIKASILVCHGADDPHVKLDEVNAFWQEMQEAKADWQLIAYGGAQHSFTNPKADFPGAKYDEKAAERSWEDMKDFFANVLKGE
ncbi:MAG: dienelactone hydrolase family protein [Candidatus Hydrogenedentes bacterium]|nr:dienelactone hydrolase family protein [Candidatus Hydrogenedentota bacterium]